jgi:hypothetical protein
VATSKRGSLDAWAKMTWNGIPGAVQELGRAGEELASEGAGFIQAEARKNLQRNRSIVTGRLYRSVGVVAQAGGNYQTIVGMFYGPYVERYKPFFWPAVTSAKSFILSKTSILVAAMKKHTR